MGKNMARVTNGVVTNIEWTAEYTKESDTLKDICDHLINVGDTYVDGKFYRNGIEVLSYEDHLKNIINLYNNALTEIENAVSTTYVMSETSMSIEARKQTILTHITNTHAVIKQGGLQ